MTDIRLCAAARQPDASIDGLRHPGAWPGARDGRQNALAMPWGLCSRAQAVSLQNRCTQPLLTIVCRGKRPVRMDHAGCALHT